MVTGMFTFIVLIVLIALAVPLLIVLGVFSLIASLFRSRSNQQNKTCPRCGLVVWVGTERCPRCGYAGGPA